MRTWLQPPLGIAQKCPAGNQMSVGVGHSRLGGVGEGRGRREDSKGGGELGHPHGTRA